MREKILPPKKDADGVPAQHRPIFDWSKLAFNVFLPVGGVLVALLVGGIMLVSLKADPIKAYAAMLEGSVSSFSGITQSLVKATPMLLVGLGICIAFRANVINIGGEGQITFGAIVAAWFPFTFNTWPGWILIPTTLPAPSIE